LLATTAAVVNAQLYVSVSSMLITEELKTDAFEPLTFEEVNKAEQNRDWENKDGGSINVDGARGTTQVNFGGTQTYAMLVRKSAVNGTIGAAKLLKVMSGDKIHTKVDYYYNVASASTNDNANTLTTLVNSVISNITTTSAASQLVKGDGLVLSTSLQGDNDLKTAVNTAASTNPLNTGQVAPRAYLCVLFFNELFEFDKDYSLVIPVAYLQSGAKGSISRIGSNAIPVKKNGYAYVYFTNESDEMVYFDNFILSRERSAILEETHYYPFGLTMAGISSKEVGGIQNKEKAFQGQRFDDDLGLDWVQFKWRNHDPQIGRFIEIDPFADKYVYNSTYAFSENKVTGHIELEGLEAYAVYNKNTGLLAIIPDQSIVNSKLDYKYVSAGEYSKLSNAEKGKHNYGILVKNVFTGGHYDADEKKIVHDDPNRPKELPIAKGEYNILENKGNTNPDHNSFFVLDPVDKSPYDKVDDRPGQVNSDGEKRSGYNLHPGSVSWGCVTVCSQDPNMTSEERKAEWNIINNVIGNTKIENVPDNRGLHKYIPFSTQKKYGTLKVVE
jgi:RHS repeat-associated protein